MEQLGLLDKEELQRCQVEEKTVVKLGRHSAKIPLKRRRREAMEKLKDVLQRLEGKDILVSQYCAFWWHDRLRLSRLHAEWGMDTEFLPCVIVLWGTRGQNIRIFTDHLYNLREQYYSDGKPYYLLDFWNGYQESLSGRYERTGYQCLHIEPAR